MIAVFPFQMMSAAQAAQAQGPASPGLSISDVKHFADPISLIVAYPVFVAASIWNYLMEHTPAAGLLAAGIAGFIAIRSIKSNRDIARLRETFNSLSGANWDADVIKARKVFSALKQRCINNPQNISLYCYEIPAKTFDGLEGGALTAAQEKYKKDIEEHEEVAGILRTILNDYENLSLGVKAGILDEDYTYRFLRGNILRDWKALSPLVTAYRHRYSSNVIYIEFEGLAYAWEGNRSYRTGKKLKITRKRTSFR